MSFYKIKPLYWEEWHQDSEYIFASSWRQTLWIDIKNLRLMSIGSGVPTILATATDIEDLKDEAENFHKKEMSAWLIDGISKEQRKQLAEIVDTWAQLMHGESLSKKP